MKRHTLSALQRQIARVERRLAHLDRLSQQCVRVRMGLALVGLCTALLAERFLGTRFGWLTAGMFVIGFMLVVGVHNRIRTRATRYTIWRRIKLTHVARRTREWSRMPPAPALPADPAHPFASDLNLIGECSLLQLLDTTTSHGGHVRLRTWLLQPVLDAQQIRARQEIVRELLPLGTFRDHLILCGALTAYHHEARWEGERVLAWLQRHTAHAALGRWVVLLGTLAAGNLLLGALYALSVLPAWWVWSWPLYLLLYLYKHSAAHDLFSEAYYLEKALGYLRAVLLYLETRRYHSTPHLARLCAPFWQAIRRPSAALKRIIRLAGAAGVQQSNVFGLLVNAIVPWDLYFVHRLNQYKDDIQTDLPVWIDTWYELEGLNALANFGALHPEYAFPDVAPAITPPQAPIAPVFRAHALGHPLLPEAERVCNDFQCEHLGEITLITGSNMSGKSTFLRTLGVNLCLAYAGAPVNATALRTVLFRVFTCMQVSDSVTDGISYFYAEVRRLKALLMALKAPESVPLFFLIDEIFRGTNNRERLIGSRAYVQALTHGHGVGVISTHDLELVTLADTVPSIRNFHFREEIQDSKMVFDYHLRPGPCPTTNALRIMQMEGLPVDERAITASPPAS